MAHLLGAEGLHLEYPTRVVFDSVTIGINEGDRIGIVGRNGDGKSSCWDARRRITPDAGRVTRRNGVRMALLDQADTWTTPAQWARPSSATGWSMRGRRRPGARCDRRARSRCAVGRARRHPVRRPAAAGGARGAARGDWDIIALDEPTNHLDVEAIAWLAEHLRRRWPRNTGGLLLVTHDRWFLDEVATTTWEVHDQLVEPFEGGYAAYVLQRVERDRQAAAVEAKRQNLMRKELAWLRRGPPPARRSPFRIDAANELIADVPPARDRVQLSQLAVARLGKQVVDLLDASVSFGDREVLRGVEWRIAPGERTAILGANGSGKSTLLGLIAGTLEPSEGRVRRGKAVRVGVLDQQFRELEAIADERVRDVLARARASYVVDGRELTPAQLLERLGFAREHLSARVKDLSGGQRRRLQLLLVLLSEPNVMVLDEPSNDVDTDMLAAMEDLLDSWPGTLIVVSHDRYLLERVTDQQYALVDGHLRHLPGGVDEYLALRAGSRVGPCPSGCGAHPSAGRGHVCRPSGRAIRSGRARGPQGVERSRAAP